MFDKDRYDRHTQQHQEARYRLRAGMAKVAHAHKRGHRQAVDAYGHPMKAQEMAERHSERTLERWARERSPKVIVSIS